MMQIVFYRVETTIGMDWVCCFKDFSSVRGRGPTMQNAVKLLRDELERNDRIGPVERKSRLDMLDEMLQELS